MSDCCNNITLEDAIALLKESQGVIQNATDKLSVFVNGGKTQDVDLGGELTPTLRKLAQQLNDVYIKIATKQRLGVVQIGDGLYVTETGLLSLDIETGTGLIFDSTGALAIDFTQMPTEKFEAMLASLRLPLWLSEDMDIYVATTGSDKLGDGRGLTVDKPFKTINAAVQYATDNYNVSRYTMAINVAAGTYRELVRLPGYNFTTGSCILKGAGIGQTLLVQDNQFASPGVSLYAISGNWRCSGFTVVLDASDWQSVGAQAYMRGTLVANSASMIIDNIAFEVKQGNIANFNRIQPICSSNGGTINIGANCRITAAYSGSSNNIITAITSYTGSSSIIHAESVNGPLSITGDFLRIAEASGGDIYRAAPSLPIVIGSATGERYRALNGGTINTQGGGEEFFPGSTAGYIQATTFSWYR